MESLKLSVTWVIQGFQTEGPSRLLIPYLVVLLIAMPYSCKYVY